MAKTASESILALEKSITKVDSQLRTLWNTYTKWQHEKDTEKKVALWDKLEKQLSTYTKSLNTAVNNQNKFIKSFGNTSALQHYAEALSRINRAQADFSAITTRVNAGRTNTQIFGEKLSDAYYRASGALRQYNSEQKKTINDTKKLNTSMTSLLPTVQKLGRAFGMYFSVRGVAQFAKKLADVRGEFELQQRALQAILMNKQKADEIWDKTMQAALQSPFTAMQLTRYTKQLAAYRIETEKLFDTTKRLADVASGLGVDMQRLILAYGQVKAANYLRASEIRQFTEAGVNILGELAQYFTDTRNGMYTTAQVMDMVQKRLVTFQDVEAIFKRLTDEGGIFYNMQYIQSQTLKGQINKLKDAYDQMLNNIGKANDGVLKNFVDLLNRIVKNWREWKTVLDTIAWPVILSFLYKLWRGLTTTAAAAVAASTSMNGVVKAGAKMQLMMKSINPWSAALVAITAVTAALWNHVKAVKAVQKEMDEQNLRLYETRENLDGYQKTLEDNNRAIKSNTLSQDELNKKRRENEGILKKIQNDYPKLAEGMAIQLDGTVKLTNALKDYNEELTTQMTIQNMMAGGGGLFSDTIKTNLTELSVDLSTLKGELISMQSTAKGGMMKMEIDKATDLPLYNYLKELSELDLSDVLQASKKANEIYNKIRYGGYKHSRIKGTTDYVPSLSAISEFRHDLPTATKDFNKIILSLEDSFEKTVSTIEDYQKQIVENYQGDISKFIANNTEEITKGVLEGNNDVIRLIRTVLVTQGGATTKEMQKYYNDILNMRYKQIYLQQQLNDLEVGSLTSTLKIWSGYKPIDFFAEGTNGDTDPFKNLDPNGKQKDSASRYISLIREMRAEYDKLAKSAYGYAKSEDKVRESFHESWDAILRETGVLESYDFTTNMGMIGALEQVRDFLNGNKRFNKDAWKEVQKYIDQLRSESEILTQTRIREDFGRQLEDAFNNYELTLELSKLNLPKGLAEELWGIDETSLVTLRERLTSMYNGLRDENGQLSGEALKDYENFLNKIDDLERKQQRERLKDYSKYLEYQYSERVKLEMDYVRKMAQLEAETAIPEEQKRAIREGIDREYAEAAKKQDWEDFKGSEFYVQMMEDLERHSTSSLEIMREKLLEMRENAENLSPRALKEVVNALEKIDKMEAGRKDPFVRWKEAMDAMRGTNIKEVYESLALQQDALSVAEEQQRQLESMIALEQERNRLESEGYTIEVARKNLGTAMEAVAIAQGNYSAYKSNGSNSSEQYKADLLENLNQAQKQQEYWENIIRILSGQAVIDQQKEGNIFAGKSLPDLLKRRTELKKTIDGLQKSINESEELTRKQKELNDATQAMLDSIKEWAQTLNGLFGDVIDTVDLFTDKTYGMTGAWKEFANSSVSALSDMISGIQKYNQLNAAALKAGNATGLFTMQGLGLALVVLGVLIKIIQALSKMHDARLDKYIEIQQDRINALTDAYARLEKQIEKTFSTVEYMRVYNQEVQNLYEQIASIEAQRSAEEEKKDTDTEKVRDYTNQIQDAYDQLDELQQKQLEVFGGIGKDNYRSWAEGFVSAWKDAFLETGDGLDALQDHFDEFLQEWFVKQATMRIAGKALEPIMQQIDSAVSGNGAVDMSRLNSIKEQMQSALEQLNVNLTDFAGWFGLGGGEGSLSGLAAGIQGMTEEQADVLEAYWNSVRGYTASIDMNVARIAAILGAGGVETNPQLQQLTNIANNTAYIKRIYDMLDGSQRNLGQGKGFVTYQL